MGLVERFASVLGLVWVFWAELVLAGLLFVWVYSSKEHENVRVKTLLRKSHIFWNSVGFMVYSKDNKGIGPKYNPDSDSFKSQPSTVKKIIFIRHGESDWNNVFNKGFNIFIFGRLFSALVEEFKMLFEMDSKFLDSPLNFEGIEQALELRRFLQSEEHPECTKESREVIDILRREKSTSVIASSSLRRAIATTTLGLWPRLAKHDEKIHILSCLQEISRNIDTAALARAKEVADLPFHRIAPHCKHQDGVDLVPAAVYEAAQNLGNKTRSNYGIKRLRAFNEWVFDRPEEAIIVGGHSLWFKNFFQTYLPRDSNHDAKNKKITNSGVVAFDLHKVETPEGPGYRIDPDSILVIFGGFTTK